MPLSILTSTRNRVVLVSLSVILLIGYCALRPSPHMREISWLPAWLSGWADRNEDLRTAVPFCALSFYIALEALLVYRNEYYAAWLSWGIAAYGWFLLLCALELLQFTLVQRTASLADLAWGTAGILLGCLPILFGGILHSLRKKLRQRIPENK